MGTAAASAGAAGPFEGLRTERSRGRSKPEYPVAGGRRDHATFGSRPTRQSDERCQTGLGARLLATSDEARACPAWYDLQFRQRFFLSDSQRKETFRSGGYE